MSNPDGSRAYPPVNDEAEAAASPFNWLALDCLLLVVFAALAMGRAHLHGYQAGVTSGLLLGLGLVAAVCTTISVFQKIQDR